MIRFRRQSDFWRPRWYLPHMSLFQERLGGRIALVTELEAQRRRLSVFNLHLESRGDEDLRLAQLEEAIADASAQGAALPTLLAGDLNFDVSRPVPASELDLVGFRSALALPSPHTTTPRGIFRLRRKIDWAYVSGPVEAIDGRVHDRVNCFRPLSDLVYAQVSMRRLCSRQALARQVPLPTTSNIASSCDLVYAREAGMVD